MLGLNYIKKKFWLFIINSLYVNQNTKRAFAAKRAALQKLNRANEIDSTVRIMGPLSSFCKLKIGSDTFIGRAFSCEGNGIVCIGKNCDIAPQVTILTGTHEIGDCSRRAGSGITTDVSIGDGVWIGACSVILPGVHIGNGCIIGAGAVVTKDVPDNTKAIGIPAKHVPIQEQATKC